MRRHVKEETTSELESNATSYIVRKDYSLVVVNIWLDMLLYMEVVYQESIEIHCKVAGMVFQLSKN